MTVFAREQKWAILILIWVAQFEWSFEWRYFLPCVCKLTSRCVIWNAQLKWRSGGIFQWRISQITQQNRRMNALTSKLWFGGGATWPSNHFRLYTAHCICTKAYETRAPCMFDWQGTQTRNAKPQIRSLHCVILCNAKWSFKLRTLLSCENSQWHHFFLLMTSKKRKKEQRERKKNPWLKFHLRYKALWLCCCWCLFVFYL